MKKIPVVENILSANDEIANAIRQQLDAAGIFGINMMASPGAGKTSLIEQTVQRLANTVSIGVIVGDIATSMDAERTEAAGARSVQINTGGNCHLEAQMVRSALGALDLAGLDLLIVENVGNLVCPSHWQLGTHQNVVIASLPEGDDKPYKYPGMYRGADVVVINKLDLLPHLDFDLAHFRRGLESLNPDVTIFEVSCRTGEGLHAWLDWVSAQVVDG